MPTDHEPSASEVDCPHVWAQKQIQKQIQKQKQNLEVKREAFHRLGLDGQNLIHGWYERGWKLRECNDGRCFEAFIYTWIAFNGWAACVTNQSKDGLMIDVLVADQELQTSFQRLLEQGDSPFCESVRTFHTLLPIFEVKELRRAAAEPEKKLVYPRPYWPRSRQELVRYYFEHGMENFEPRCARRHTAAGESVPLDLPHILKAIYKVRCNLFHGEKAVRSEHDLEIVQAAFQVLVHYIHEAQLFGWPGHAAPLPATQD